jgi:DNA-binding NarL/FixJ family response regulator
VRPNRREGRRLMSLRILVVDDHAVVRRGVRSLLESHEDCEVCGEATTGRDAVDQSRQLRPDVVVMDLSLPELNGLDATRQILKDGPGIEVLVLTMHHSEDLARDVLRAGARGYIMKSDSDENLITAVDTLRRHKPFLTSTVTGFVLDDFVRRRDGTQADVSPVDVTSREREIIQLVAEGRSNKEAAATLGISVKTIEAHRANIMRKLQLRTVSDLVRYAIRNKIVQP